MRKEFSINPKPQNTMANTKQIAGLVMIYRDMILLEQVSSKPIHGKKGPEEQSLFTLPGFNIAGNEPEEYLKEEIQNRLKRRFGISPFSEREGTFNFIERVKTVRLLPKDKSKADARVVVLDLEQDTWNEIIDTIHMFKHPNNEVSRSKFRVKVGESYLVDSIESPSEESLEFKFFSLEEFLEKPSLDFLAPVAYRAAKSTKITNAIKAFLNKEAVAV